MSTILDELAELTKERVSISKNKKPLSEIKKEAYDTKTDTGYPFEKALAQDDMTFICEIKKASPSKGIIEPDFHPVDIAKEYINARAGAISILTEPKKFMGDIEYVRQISKITDIPILRKDFTIDEYMIYEGKVYGADIILLICAILSSNQLKEYIQICEKLGLSAIIEAHDEAEIDMAINAGARIIGVNNRDLRDFSVDINNGIRLRKKVSDDIYFIAESGIKSHDDIVTLKNAHVDGVLIGETLMRADDKKEMLDNLRYGK